MAACAFAATAAWEGQARSRAAARRNADIASSLRTGLATPVELLYSLQAFLALSRQRPLTLAEFREFCAPAIARHPEIAGLEWFPFVAGDDRESFEAWARREQPGFEIREPTRAGDMVRAVRRAQHAPLTFMEPFVPAVQGLDLAFDPFRVGAAEQALARGRTLVSPRFQLVEDPPEVLSVAAYAPVLRAVWVDPAQAGGKSFERGVAVALFRLSPLISNALRGRELDDLGVELWDPAAPEGARLLFRTGLVELGDAPDEAEVAFVDRTYRLAVYAHDNAVGTTAFLASALTFVLLAGAMALAEARHKARHLARAAERLGQYQLEARIATGGMGTVFRAHHALLRRPTAIKIANDERSAASFEAEALLTCSLTHPNTVVIYDYGRGRDGAFYCAMEYIDGYDLEQLVQQHGRLPPARAVRVLLQAAAALDEAHGRGLVHRDVKPSNIMLTERGGTRDFVKVLDFGLARSQLAPSSSGPRSVTFAGTPGYAAPEVIAGSAAGPASDVFSLGAVAHFLLAGQGPFCAADSSTDALTRTLSAEPAPLPADTPDALARIVRACLEKSPSLRVASMTALAERLRGALASCTPWTREDAEHWWRDHPPSRTSSPLTSSAATFVPAGRGLRTSLSDAADSAVRRVG